MMASPQWKPFQPPNNHDNATTFAPTSGRSTSMFSSSFSSSSKNFSSNSNSNSNHNKSSSPSSSSSNSYQNQNQGNSSGTSNDLSSSPGASGGFREAGIVEKLLPSYGFIQCCERQARLFFHYSQFNGNIEHLKLGDPVEFEMTYDRRTGKPIASAVVKISSEAALMSEELSSERVAGFITIEVTDEKEGRVAYENRGECFFLPFTKEDVDSEVTLRSKDRVTFHIATDKSGNLRARKITLETPTPERFEGVVCTLKDSFGFIERADIVKEIFFHSSEAKDFKGLTLGDDIEFSVQTRNNKEVAVNVTRLPPGTVVFEDISPEQLTGQIAKTIERGIHSYSRQQQQQTHSSSSSNSSGGNGGEPFPGRIRYKKSNSEVDISFGERDLKGDFTLQVGDWVKFNVVTDRRDKLQHATNIDLYDESFSLSGEHREQGYIAALKDSYGFIKCLNREGTRVYFRLAEMLDANLSVKLNDEVEFTVSPDLSSPGRLQAIRIKALPNGTIFKNLLTPKQPQDSDSSVQSKPSPYFYSHHDRINGFSNSESRHEYQHYEFPLIDLNTETPQAVPAKKTVPAPIAMGSQGYAAKSDSWSEILSQIPITLGSSLDTENIRSDSNQMDLLSSEGGDSQINTLKPLEPTAYADRLTARKFYSGNNDGSKGLSNSNSNSISKNEYNGEERTQFKNGMRNLKKGFIAALKESYGFIENEDHQTEVFFHYSVFEGNVQNLDLGQEVEYYASVKAAKLSAEYVGKLPGGSIPLEEGHGDVLTGVITQSVRCLNPDQDEYPGYIEVSDVAAVPGSAGDSNGVSGEGTTRYEFSMTSLEDIHEFVQKGDVVTFQVGVSKSGKKRAVNMKPIRNKYQATVDAIKGSFGFLNYEVEDGKKLFFHMSEVKGENGGSLHPGDSVEFVVVHNQRSGKYSACSVLKLTEPTNTQRPERLIARIKAMSVDDASGPRIVLVRQPRGPDGSNGFTIPRQPASVVSY